MRLASIDIGSNTIRLLVADVDRADTPLLNVVARRRCITRLGGGFSETEGLSADAIERTISALKQFRALIDDKAVAHTTAVATSVVRRAANRDHFIERVKKEASIDVEVIDGTEEARLSVVGVLSVIKPAREDILMVDVGGGSTEFVYCRGGQILKAVSVEKMGVVHLTEEFIKTDPPTGQELKAMEQQIYGFVESVKERLKGVFNAQRCELCGTAGTVTTLAAIEQGLSHYMPERINNYLLRRDAAERLYGRLSAMRLEERTEQLGLERGREDLIIPGIAIVLACMDGFGLDTMRVSDAGLLEGLIIDTFKKRDHYTTEGGVD